MVLLSGFADFVEGFEKGRDIGFVGIEGDGDGFGFEVTDDIFDTFLIGDILHDLVATTLTMQVAGKNYHLFVRLGSHDAYYGQ